MAQNEEEKSEELTKRKSIKDTGFVKFFKSFVSLLLHDKKYLFSFLVSLFFFCLFFSQMTNESEGYIQKLEKSFNKNDNTVEPTVDDNIDANSQGSERLDISDYVGIYSREVSLSDPIEIDDSCKVSQYKIIYKVNKDNSIYKYFYSECLGTFKIWNDTLKYNISNSARYISAHEFNYLFSTTGIKEIDGDTYRYDDSLTNIKESNSNRDIKVLFFDNNIVFLNNNMLSIVKGNNVVLNTLTQYKSSGGNLEKLVYQSSNDGQFNFIVFSNNEALNCYDSYEDSNTNTLYSIYKVTYNQDNSLFEEPKLVLERKVNEGCKNWQEDLKKLKQ